LESVIYRDKCPNYLEKALKVIDRPNDKRIEMFEDLNGLYFERIGYQLPPQPQIDTNPEMMMAGRRDNQ